MIHSPNQIGHLGVFTRIQWRRDMGSLKKIRSLHSNYCLVNQIQSYQNTWETHEIPLDLIKLPVKSITLW